MGHKKILPKHHTGRIRHHRHTSYGALLLVLLLALIPLVTASRSVALAASDPVTISNEVYAVVSAPTPTTAPAITNIAQGAVYTNNEPLTVSGTCPNETLVKVFKNDVFSGAVFCQNGRFSVPIDLFLGSNTLIVRAYNSTNSMAPESTPIVVRKDIPGTTFTSGSQQFFVTSEILYKGVNVGSTLSWPVTITGGQAPYAISVAWGDGKTDLISRGEAGSLNIEHVYDKSGDGYKSSYNVTITSTDALGNKSFIHLVSIVGGNDPSVVSSIKQGYSWSTAIRIAWQLMIVAGLIVLAFWLGEKRESHILKRK